MSEDRLDHPGARARRPESSGFHAFIHSDYAAAIGSIIFAGVVYYWSTFIESVPEGMAQGLQPASYPQGVLVAVVFFALIILLEARTKVHNTPEPVPGLAYMTTLVMFGCLAISTWVDFFGGLILFVCLVVPLWGERRYFRVILYALCLVGVMYLLFAVSLGVRFPRGVLYSLLS